LGSKTRVAVQLKVVDRVPPGQAHQKGVVDF
jgi:hypothetical protein